MVTVIGNGAGDTSSNPESDYFSQNVNTLDKYMNPTILPSAQGKIVGQTCLFSLGRATDLKIRKTLYSNQEVSVV